MENAKIQLETNEKFIIEEEEDWMEALTCGCLVDNREFQMSINPAMTGKREIITIKEDSEFLCRCLLAPRCRGFTGSLSSFDRKEEMFKYEKPCGIPICSVCRPEFEVKDAEGRTIGIIKNECKLCEMYMTIQDKDGQDLYVIKGTMCSLGFCCEPVLGSCFPLTFDIQDSRKSGVTVSQFKKESRGLFPEC